MATPRRLAVFLAGLGLVASACSWQPKPLVSDGLGRPAETSKVLAADGSLLTTLHAGENREVVPLERIPKELRDAVVAVEDRRFWHHEGVDTRAVLRALWANATEGSVMEGGSTITQQYVKNELVGDERTVRRKIKEAAVAYQIEQRYSKEEILERYLNTVYFGNGAYGVEAAARRYFGVGAEQLTLGQAALLAGLIQAPARTDPYDHPEAALARRRVVLDAMVDLEWTTRERAAGAAAEPLVAAAVPPDDRHPAPYFVERVKRVILDDPGFGPTPQARRDLLFGGGLRIHTTLDPRRQAQAEEAVAKVLSRPDRDPSAALVALEPRTGFVRALVGGRDFYGGGSEAKFDLATQGHRPAGSAFKPFVLAAALEQGIGLGTVYAAPSRLTIPLSRQRWEVENYEGRAGGRMTLAEATVASVNTVYAKLILDVGPAQAVETATRMGVTSPLRAYPSAVLGTNDVTPIEMASAYGTLANQGMAVPPTFVTKVERADGTVLFEHHHSQRHAVRPETAAAVVSALQRVVERGTGVGARIGRPVAGKTGTGQQWRDAWFVGFTPDLVTSVWVGFPDRQRSMVPPATRLRVTGGSWPAQIWQLYMSAALAGTPVTPFAEAPDRQASEEAVRREVPALVGMPVDAAEAALEEAGFRAERVAGDGDDYPPGYVVGQDPRPGAERPGGATVTLEISTGVASTTVPDFLALTAAEAEQRAREASVSLDVVEEADPAGPAGAGPGRIWKQSLPAGTDARQGASVRVSVNPGP